MVEFYLFNNLYFYILRNYSHTTLLLQLNCVIMNVMMDCERHM